MSLADDIAGLLATGGAGVVGTTIFAGQMPSTPADVTAVLEYGGAPPLRAFGANGVAATAQEDGRAQILIRRATYVAARDAAEAALAAVDWKSFTGSTGRAYQLVEAVQRPGFPLGQDQNQRWQFVINLRARRSAA